MEPVTKLALGLLAGVSAIAVSSTALAQAAAPSSDVEAVVVTGSRLIVNGNASPVPVAIMTQETMRNVQPTTLADGLNMMPVFAGSRTQSSNPSATGAVGGGNGAANQLNLRGLGSNRNLILMDGRRVPPASTTNIVDVDIIPEMLIQRVDVVTGGVSAVYGSDAVTGVVNYITDTKFNGFKANATYGQTQYDDSKTVNLGIAFGTKLGDRGHFEGSLSYYNDKGVTRRSDRDWWQQNVVQGSGTAAAPYNMYANVRVTQTPFGGVIIGGPLNDQIFKTNGVLTPFVHGKAVGSACCEVGGDGGYFDSNMKTPLEAKQAYARFDYELTDNIHFFATAAGNFKTNQIYADPANMANLTYSSQNAFLPAAARATLVTAGTTFRMGKLLEQGGRYAPRAVNDQYVFTAGLDGKLGGWNWSATYWRGISKLETQLKNIHNFEKLYAALDAVVNPANGQIVCNTDLTNPGLRPGCVPLNPFGPTSASDAALGYVLGDTWFKADTTTHNFNAAVTGELFNLPAGPVGVAVSGEYRTIDYVSTSNGDGSLLANCTGLRFNCVQGTTRVWGQAFAINPKTAQHVTEGSGELNVPLLKDYGLFQSLSVNGAARYTHYDTTGNFWTWKLGGDWTVNDQFRMRGTISRDIRAPTLDDLNTNQSTAVNFQTQQDLLTGLSPRVPNGGGGGSAPIQLTAEIGHTITGGFVWRPAPGLTLSIDYYRIKVTGAIVGVQGFNPLIQAACYASGGSSPYCQLQSRPNGFTDRSPANAVTAWRGTTLNIASITTNGIDVESNYTTRVFGLPTNLRFLASWQPHQWAEQPGLPTIDNAGVAFGPNGQLASPKWRLTWLLHVNLTEKLSVDLAQRWRSGMKLSADETQVWINNWVKSYGSTNATVSYNFEAPHLGQTQVFANVQNLFNTVPPIAGYYGNVAVPGMRDGWVSGDSPIGRYFTVGARIRR